MPCIALEIDALPTSAAHARFTFCSGNGEYTRVFVPLTPKVLNSYSYLGKCFLHFSEPESLEIVVVPY